MFHLYCAILGMYSLFLLSYVVWFDREHKLKFIYSKS